MRVVLQRVSSAKVEVDGIVTGSIESGLLVLVGVQHGDKEGDATYLLHKTLNLRIFNDASGKMNLSVRDIKGSLLIVSQFTLYADCRKGMRPSFDKAARPEEARLVYEYFVAQAKASGILTQTGIFQASMKVSLTNDGPVTLICESGTLTPSE